MLSPETYDLAASARTPFVAESVQQPMKEKGGTVGTMDSVAVVVAVAVAVAADRQGQEQMMHLLATGADYEVAVSPPEDDAVAVDALVAL